MSNRLYGPSFTAAIGGQTLAALPAAGALAGTDVELTRQGTTDAQTTRALHAAFVLAQELPTVTLVGNTVLTQALHHNRDIFCTVGLTLTAVPGAATGDGFKCRIINSGTGVVSLGSGITGLSGITSLAAGGTLNIVGTATTMYAIGSGAAAVASPALTTVSISGVSPGGTSTATLSFANGAPASLTATVDGAAVTLANIVVTTTSGTGATASGTASATFTTPATGTHSVVFSGTGAYAGAAAAYSLVTSSTPQITISGVTPLGVGLTATATGTFASGAPATITVTNDGASLTIGNVAISTTSGTGATAAGTFSFTFTNPAASSHILVATGTGTYAATSAGYSFTTAALGMTVSTITAPAPSTPFAVSGSASNFTPSAVQYSLDGGTTWVTASSPTINGNGTYSFTTSAGVAASGTAYTVQVRDPAQPAIVGTSNAFTVTALSATMTAPTSPVANTTPTFSLTIAGSGSPSVWASVTISGAEQTPRTQVAYGSTSVAINLPTAAGGVVCSGNLYAASSGGAAIATTGNFTPTSAAAGPGAVTNVVIGIPSSTTVPVTWTAPATGTAPTSYKVELSSDGGATYPTIVNTGNTQTYYQFTGLTASTSYIARVSGSNTNGTGATAVSAAKSTVAAAAAQAYFTAFPTTVTAGSRPPLTFTCANTQYSYVYFQLFQVASPNFNYAGQGPSGTFAPVSCPQNGTATIRGFTSGGSLICETPPFTVSGATPVVINVDANHVITLTNAMDTTVGIKLQSNAAFTLTKNGTAFTGQIIQYYAATATVPTDATQGSGYNGVYLNPDANGVYHFGFLSASAGTFYRFIGFGDGVYSALGGGIVVS